MKALVFIGGLVAASAVAASFVYNGAPNRSSPAESAPSNSRPAASGSKIATMSAAQVLAASTHSSPKSIFTASVKSPDALQKVFDEKGADWATENLTTPITAGGKRNSNRSDCPGETDDSPKRTMYVRYVTDYPDNERGRATLLYTNIKVPVVGGGRFSFETPFITEKIIRDRYEWKRNYHVKWWQGTDQNWEEQMREELTRLDARFKQTQRENPTAAIGLAREMAAIRAAIKNQQVTALNETVHDIVEVEAPSPAWSFKYNNHTGKGDALYRRDKDIDYTQRRDEIEQNAEAILTALEPIKEFGESLESKGVRTILGHTCKVMGSTKFDAEQCVAEIDGERITLWSRVSKAQKTAVYLDTSPCVSLAQFRPPTNIEFDDKW